MPSHNQYAASIYVDTVAYRVDRPFTYLVPPALVDTLKRGCRVVVPFAQGNKRVQGLVAELFRIEQSDKQLKSILFQLDPEPILTEEMFTIINYLVENTFCPYYSAVRAILPVGTNIDITETFVLSAAIDGLELARFSPEQQRVIEFLRTAKTARELSSLLDCRTNPAKRPIIKQFIEQGIITASHEITQRVAPKQVKLMRLRDDYVHGAVKLTKVQQKLVELLSEVQVATTKELADLCATTQPTVKKLVGLGVVEVIEREVVKQYTVASDAHIDTKLDLSDAQSTCADGISTLIDSGKHHVALLHGVTGSGKTLVYIKLIEHVLNSQNTAILLAPEISLTPQLSGRFIATFGDIVAVMHSSLSINERLEQFNRIRAGSVRIVIGTRSAIFAPLERLGLIILDEEGEGSYKSGNPPRYHARDVATLRGRIHGATVVLGSATPSVESYYRAESGRYQLFTLQERYNNALLPSVFIVDMQEEQQSGNFSPLSRILQEQIAANLRSGEQTILLINRRGYNTYATCMQCGEVIQCPHCDVAMTYHKTKGQLICHYCGYSCQFESRCPSCSSAHIKLTGAGTQRLEDEVSTLFPQARVLRMDSDTTYARDAYERCFEEFREHQHDIMLGTQMIAKGLDFPDVTLVGVINAEGGLYSEDFRSGERVFSLITQVVGRGGRDGKAARAYVQSLDPYNPVIGFAAEQDYRSFYRDEIAMRKASLNPPFCDICVIGFSGLDPQTAENAANRMVALLAEAVKLTPDGITMRVLGVASAAVYRVSNHYRYRIIVKCRFNREFKRLIADAIKGITSERAFTDVNIAVDVNGSLNL